jgi:hypothetical protein
MQKVTEAAQVANIVCCQGALLKAANIIIFKFLLPVV